MPDQLLIERRRLLSLPVPGEIEKPSAANTGPRVAITGSILTGDDAINAAIANGGTLTGRHIRDVVFDELSYAGLVFNDCLVEAPSFYGVQAWWGVSPRPPSNEFVTFNYCEFESGEAACIAGSNVKLRHCNMHRGVDLIKLNHDFEVYGCYLHDVWEPDSEAHADTIQIRSGSNVLIHWNTIDAFNAPDSPSRPGQVCSGGLQTGSQVGDIANFQMLDNWVDGGVITLRGGGDWTGFSLDMTFKRNQHGRGYSLDPITAMTLDPPRVVHDYDLSNVWQDTGTPVLEG